MPRHLTVFPQQGVDTGLLTAFQVMVAQAVLAVVEARLILDLLVQVVQELLDKVPLEGLVMLRRVVQMITLVAVAVAHRLLVALEREAPEMVRAEMAALERHLLLVGRP
jgi:hypothetical protein